MPPRKILTQSQAKPVLFIDTTVQNELTVAVVSGHVIKRLTQPIGLAERDDVLRYIDRLIRRLKISLSQLESIVVVRGPGPFTATRVGVTVANALGLALGIPVRGVKKTAQTDIMKLINQTDRTASRTNPILPFYDRAPNITMPRKKEEVRSKK